MPPARRGVRGARPSRLLNAALLAGDIHLLHIGSARPLRKLAAAGRTAAGGAASVRDLHWDAARRQLASCSFDKTVRLWGEAPS